MSRLRPERWPAPRSWRIALAGIVLVDLAFLVWGVLLGANEVSDGEAGVTDGYIIASGVALTFLFAWALRFLPIRPRTLALGQMLALGAQVLHAGGHLFRLYYSLEWYDDLLHFGLVLALGLVLVDATRSRRFLFNWQSGPFRVAALIWLASVAIAGVWELFEFVADVALGTREQDDLVDTMLDMLDGAAGATVASIVAWRRVKREAVAKRLADARSDDLLD